MDNFLKNNLRCPDCKGNLSTDQTFPNLICMHCEAEFPIFDNSPILLSKSNTLFPKNALYISLNNRIVSQRNKMARYIPKLSINLAREKLDIFFRHVSSFAEENAQVLVIGSGTQKTWMDRKSSIYKNIKLIYTDIDTTSMVDIYCDAHELPFIDSIFDGVITTAVLEHVLYPEIVAKEIDRVLRIDGLLYSEIPFMQQVHEGKYDFTRYTLSGHRRLFNSFTEIDAGMVAGPGTVLAWSIENFILAFFMNQTIRKTLKILSRVLFFWLKYFDLIFKNKHQAMDGASCTYFLGKKNNQFKISDKKIIDDYKGAKQTQHII